MQIRSATAADLPAIAHILGETFAADPVMREYISPNATSTDDMQAQHTLTRYFRSELDTEYFPHGKIDLAVESGQILGVALWLPPEANPGTAAHLRQLITICRLLKLRTLRALQLRRHWVAATPKFPHWYLYTLAATPAARGKGVGTALLQHGLSRAAADPVYLEATSERAAALYEKLGFVKLGIIPTPLQAKEIAMWRPADAPPTES